MHKAIHMVNSWWLCTWSVWTDETDKDSQWTNCRCVFFAHMAYCLWSAKPAWFSLVISVSCASTHGQFWLWNQKPKGFLNFESQGLDAKSQMTWNGFLLPDSWGQPWYPGCQGMKTFIPVRFSMMKLKRILNFIVIHCHTSTNITTWFMSSANDYMK